jgi:hypothetical protein
MLVLTISLCWKSNRREEEVLTHLGTPSHKYNDNFPMLPFYIYGVKNPLDLDNHGCDTIVIYLKLVTIDWDFPPKNKNFLPPNIGPFMLVLGEDGLVFFFCALCCLSMLFNRSIYFCVYILCPKSPY